ncbi:hypothetical protein K1T71_007711 [Dendrolimus kikuchii]|uniref:Uncharacterized protein n=1 Tax=Dendrolimus kikuchii TaxID=765133 RepID=A0ACC1CZ17_9NEOP|nr:hypothetical protein K1T71_007711 [Dendrolimus kikuchii]
MGGCRCTYRNCTVKTDGATHMFHYPVFDKVRCHQWLINAQRLEFLNLKVSQLKNRVVCQHHFKDDCFMNFLKERLTFEAIPTEDGPFCDSSQLPVNNSLPEVAKVTRDYIEHEYLSTTEKKANFSVKYGDFLTNCEVMDMVNLDLRNETNENEHESARYKYSTSDSELRESNVVNFLIEPNKITPAKKPQQSSITMPHSKPVVLGVQFDELTLSTENQKQSTNKIEQLNIKPKSKKIKILSEKKISEPLKITGVLTPVSPSIVIESHIKNENASFENNDLSQIQYVVINKNKEIENFVPSTVCKEKEEIDITKNFKKTNNIGPLAIHHVNSLISNVRSQEVRSSKTLSPQKLQMQTSNMKDYGGPPSKISPERLATIEKKRKFNMKLKDIIESCLEKLDENDEEKTKLVKSVKCKAQDSNSPNVPEYALASLEARLKRMEEVLLNKINQNSARINELKGSITSTSPKRKSCRIQAVQNDDVRKRQLYQDISKYLSPETSSLVYEELFLNKYGEKLPAITAPSHKKRRKRSFINTI